MPGMPPLRKSQESTDNAHAPVRSASNKSGKLSDSAPPHLIRKCVNLALRSNLTHKHGCVIVKDGAVVSRGYNHKKGISPIECIDNTNRQIFSVHAEMAAIRNAKKKNLINSDMYVVRIGPKCGKRCFDASKDVDTSLPLLPGLCAVETRSYNPSHSNDPPPRYLKYSHPCEVCGALIRQCGIRRVFYSVDDDASV